MGAHDARAFIRSGSSSVVPRTNDAEAAGAINHLLLQMDEEVEEGGQDVALSVGEEVGQAALLRCLGKVIRQRQRVLQPQEDAPEAARPLLTYI